MSEGKSHRFRPPLYHTDSSGTSSSDGSIRRASTGEKTTEQNGWEAYRKWLSSVSGKLPPSERAPLDASIYSWKGYQNWADRVRQSWKAEES